MRREHLLKRLRITRPRAIREWPVTGIVFVGLLAAVVIAAIWLTLVVRPATLPTSATPADQWAALGAIYGAGALSLAVLATVIATVAYTNATERPALVMHSSMAMQ